MTGNTGPAHTSRRHAQLLSAALITVVALVSYARTYAVPWLLDDVSTVAHNTSLQTWATALRPAADSTVGGRPFANLTFAANHAWGGDDVLGYHILNLAIHLAAGLVFFGIVRRTLEQRVGVASHFQSRAGLGPADAACVALASAVLWISHPILTVSVTYISQRTECLMGLCYLVTLYAFMRGSDRGAVRRWQALSVAACAAGMATKESMVTAPVLVLLYDRVFVAPSFAVIARQRACYYAGLAATWVLLGALMMSDLHLRRVGFGLGVSWWNYALTECSAILLYLRLSVWPSPLVFDYGPIFTGPTGSAMIIAALAGGPGWRRSVPAVAPAADRVRRLRLSAPPRPHLQCGPDRPSTDRGKPGLPAARRPGAAGGPGPSRGAGSRQPSPVRRHGDCAHQPHSAAQRSLPRSARALVRNGGQASLESAGV